MNRRKALQYMASLAGGAAGLGLATGCAHGGPPMPPNGGGGRGEGERESGAAAASSGVADRAVRAEHLYVAVPMAPGVDIRAFGFKHAMMLPAKAFVDADGMSVRSRMREAIASRLASIPDPDFRGPFVLDMEGPTYVGGLKSSDPQTYEMSARRMNAAILDVLSIVPDAIVSTYDSPHVHKGREDYAVASRAIQRLHPLGFFNPSLYDNRSARRESEELKEAALRQRVVRFACDEAKRLGVPHVLPMLHHRYRGASRVKKDEALQVIEKEEFLRSQVLAARDGGAHGVILWHADLHRMELARNPKKASNPDKGAVAQRQFGDVTLAELAQVHRSVLQWTAEAFLADPT